MLYLYRTGRRRALCKMVHNGIEYADMQLIAEAYILLRSVAGYTNAELGDILRNGTRES